MFITFAYAQDTLTYFIELTGDYRIALFIFSILLLFLPVFVASQTLPLLTEYIDDDRKGLAAGKIFFYSTVGSFFGSILTPVVFFEEFGVTKTIYLVGFLLIGCALMIEWERVRKIGAFSIFMVFIGAIIFLLPTPSKCSYNFDSAYQDICIYETTSASTTNRIFSLNGGYSSGINASTGKSFFVYIQEALRITKEVRPENILLLGGAGFTYPQEISAEDFVKNIDVVDVDGVVKEIAEKHFLQKPLSEKIDFHPISGRYFLNQSIRAGKQYDLTFVDVYFGKLTIPNEFLTQEFFRNLGTITKDQKVVFNMIFDTPLASEFVTNTFTTLKSVYGEVYYKKVSNGDLPFTNYIVSMYPFENYELWRGETGEVYTDDQ